MATLKPMSITAETLEDLRLQLNYVLDKLWSYLDHLTGSTQNLTETTAENEGNFEHNPVFEGFPAQPIEIVKIAPAIIDASKVKVDMVWLLGDLWSNNTPVAGSIAWNTHNLYYAGIEYAISCGSSGTDNQYIYWKIGDNNYSVTNDYDVVISSGNFLIAVNEGGVARRVWSNPSAPVAIGTAAIADAAIISAKIANAAINDAHIASLSAEKITTGYLSADRIKSRSITADKIELTLYGDISQALNFSNAILSIAPEWTKTLTVSDLNAGTSENMYISDLPDYGVAMRNTTQTKWDDTGANWDSGLKWDKPVLTPATWTDITRDFSFRTQQLSLLCSVYEDHPPSSDFTVEVIYSLDGTSWGSNSPYFDDGLWETCRKKVTGTNTYRVTGSLYEYRYQKVRITLTTNDTNQRIILYNLSYVVDVVNVYQYFENQFIHNLGTSFSLSGYHKTPAVSVIAHNNPYVPVVYGKSESGFSVKLYDFTNTAVNGYADIIVMGE